MHSAYFLLNTAALDYPSLINQSRTEHEKNSPGCLLSITPNRDGSLALVKVAGVRQNWINSSAVLDKCDSMEDHRTKFVPLVRTASWSDGQ